MMLPLTAIGGASPTVGGEQAAEPSISLNERRHRAVLDEVRAAGSVRVLDLGCSDGRLLERLLDEPQLEKVCGVDASLAALERAETRVKRHLEARRPRVELVHGALTYLDTRLVGYDTATLVEVIEHLDLERLNVFIGIVFGHLHPDTVIVTTPNIEYNVHLENLPPSGFRHGDHRFEWTRDEFSRWAERTAVEHGYEVRYRNVGVDDPTTGPPTQMAVFAGRRAGLSRPPTP